MSTARVLILMAAALAAGAALALRPRPGPAPAIDQQLAVERYAGASTCASCHPRESRDFAGTAHARALFRADSEAATRFVSGRAAPQSVDGNSPRHSIEYDWADGQLWARSPTSAGDRQMPVEWCFGSGEFGTTFVTMLQDRRDQSRLLEHHWSWFRDGDVLALTPGHTLDGRSVGYEFFGDISDPASTRQCFSCHATAFQYESGRLDTRSVIAGVQCERCHGPRKEHVELKLRTAASAPAKPAARPPARQQVYACGECHRRPDEITDEIRPDNAVIARFPSVGLVQSNCFLATESKGTLTCTTCHDPHHAGHPTTDFYDSRCHDCHDPRRDRNNVPCSIDPGDRSCVGCHMPKVPLHEHLNFTDHWIRAQRTPSRARSESSSGVSGRDMAGGAVSVGQLGTARAGTYRAQALTARGHSLRGQPLTPLADSLRAWLGCAASVSPAQQNSWVNSGSGRLPSW